MAIPTLEIDGERIDTLDDFFREFRRHLWPDTRWGTNLDAFNDVLRGGFGTPEGGFRLVWKSSSRSRQRLGYAETILWLERKLTTCHPANVPSVREDLEAARSERGPTLFDILVEIICEHGRGGQEAEDGVELVLE